MSGLSTGQKSSNWAPISGSTNKYLDSGINPDGTYTATATNSNGPRGEGTQAAVTTVTAVTEFQARQAAQKINNQASETGSLSLPSIEPGVTSAQVQVGNQAPFGAYTASSKAQFLNPVTGLVNTVTDNTSAPSLSGALLVGSGNLFEEKAEAILHPTLANQFGVSPEAAQAFLDSLGGNDGGTGSASAQSAASASPSSAPSPAEQLKQLELLFAR